MPGGLSRLGDSKLRKAPAFSLLELLVVVAIVAILAAAALPNFQRMVERSRVQDAQTTLNMIFHAERIYRLDNNAFGTLAQLVAGRYLSSDPNTNTTNWTFATANVAAATFTATATRVGGGVFNGNTISLDQNFTGAPNPNPPYNGSRYAGTHPLRD